MRGPFPEDSRITREAYERHRASEQQAVLQLHALQPSRQRALVAGELLGIGKNFDEQTNRDDVDTEQRQHHAQGHRVDIEADFSGEARAR